MQMTPYRSLSDVYTTVTYFILIRLYHGHHCHMNVKVWVCHYLRFLLTIGTAESKISYMHVHCTCCLFNCFITTCIDKLHIVQCISRVYFSLFRRNFWYAVPMYLIHVLLLCMFQYVGVWHRQWELKSFSDQDH